MKKIIRIALIAASVVLVILAAGIGLAVTVINPNDFKPEIEAAAFRATGKKLSLQGDLSLSFFPGLGLEAGPAELRDDPSFGPESFARVEKIHASARLMPLFSGKAEIQAISVSGLRLKLAVNDKGAANWAMPQPPKTTPDAAPGQAKDGSAKAGFPALTLDALEITDTLVVYTDMRTGSSMRLAVPAFSLDSLKAGQTTTLAVEAAYAGPSQRPLTLVLNADFVSPASLDESLPFNAKGKLGDTPFSCAGTAAFPGTAKGPFFSLTSDISVGALNLDSFTAVADTPKQAAPSGQKTTARAQAASTGETLQKILRAIFLDLRIAMESVTVANVPIKNIRASIKTDHGLLVAKPVTMVIAGGALAAEASVDATGKDIHSRTTGNWKAAHVGELLRSATGKTSLTGDLDASWGLNATGTAWPEIAKTMGGKASATLVNGSLPGVTLIPAGVPGLPAHTMDITNILASGAWNIANGIARTDDLAAKAAGLDAAGNGTMNIPGQSLYYNVSVKLPTLPQLPKLTVLPMIISGTFDSIAYSLDQPAFLRDTAKSLLDPSTKTGREIERGLGKLFGR